MRKIIFILILVIIGNYTYSQDFCQTPVYTANPSLNIFNSANFGSGAYGSKTLRLYFHVVRRVDGSGGDLPFEVSQAYNILQDDYNPNGIYFAWDGCIDYIDNSILYNFNAFGQNIFSTNNHTDGIDVYLYPKTNLGAGGQANGVGSSSEFFVSGTWSGTGPFLALSHIISHEMGHVLFLWHSHHGTFPEGGNDNPCPELVNGSNASFCGDNVIDTPADPHIQFNVNSNCEWLGSGQDANGDSF